MKINNKISTFCALILSISVLLVISIGLQNARADTWYTGEGLKQETEQQFPQTSSTATLVAHIAFDKTAYTIGETAKVYLYSDDPFYNELGKVPVRVTSTSDPDGMKIALIKTKDGTFVGQIHFTSDPTSNHPPFLNLHVRYFDVVTVTTLVGPHASTRISDYEEHGDLTIQDVRMMRSTGVTKLYSAINALNPAIDFSYSSNATDLKNVLLDYTKNVNQTVLNGEYYATFTNLSKIKVNVTTGLSPSAKGKILPIVDGLITSLKIDTTPIPEFPFFMPLLVGFLLALVLSFKNRSNLK